MDTAASTTKTGRTREIIAARGELARALSAIVRPDGSTDGPGGSRIVESALAARLLAAGDAHSPARAGLAHFVRTASPADGVERMARQVFLHPDQNRSLRARFLGEFRHHTGLRKRALLDTMLALLGSDSPDNRSAAAARHYRGHAQWTELALCSTVILHHAARGERRRADERFLLSVLRTGDQHGVWQDNLLAHVLALHTVRTFDPDGSVLREGMAAIVGAINPDGGVPFITAQDIWVSALAGAALSGVPPMRAVAARIGDFIAARQLGCGGWGFCRSTSQCDLDDTSRCVALLAALDSRRHSEAVASGRSHLLRSQCSSGGFPTYSPKDPAEADMTAGAVIALAPDPTAGVAVARAVDFLLAAQRSDGTFEPSWTRSESSVLNHVAEALLLAERHCPHRVTEMRATVGRAVDRLAQTQNGDGGWGHHPGAASDVISTSHAVRLLAHHDPRRVATALDHLLAARGPDGRFTSVPDQVGPRPIPYAYPVLTDVHVLAAFNAVLSRA